MSYTFSEPVGKLLSLDLSYGFSNKIMQCVFVFTVKNNVIYFQLSIVDNIQKLIRQYMHMKSYPLNKALAQDFVQQVPMSSIKQCTRQVAIILPTTYRSGNL